MACSQLSAELPFFELPFTFAIRKVKLNIHYMDHSTSLSSDFDGYFWAVRVTYVCQRNSVSNEQIRFQI